MFRAEADTGTKIRHAVVSARSPSRCQQIRHVDREVSVRTRSGSVGALLVGAGAVGAGPRPVVATATGPRQTAQVGPAAGRVSSQAGRGPGGVSSRGLLGGSSSMVWASRVRRASSR